ncbi:MAG: hypothetical protein KIT31_29035 [Deltaproteobacteria bacterium]|nr:hypothetical protein [Deltaproteobacteria bacterium]
MDAPKGVDAPVGTIMSVACDGSEVATIESTGGFRFSPNTATISVNDVIKFENAAEHSIVPSGANADSGFVVGFGATACLKFTAAGTFAFRCNPHTSMTGTITVN